MTVYSSPSLTMVLLGIIVFVAGGSSVAAYTTTIGNDVVKHAKEDLSLGDSIRHLRSWAASTKSQDSHQKGTNDDATFQGRRKLATVCKPEIKCVEPKDTNNPVQGCAAPTPLTDPAQIFTVVKSCGKTFSMLTPITGQDGSVCTSVLKGRIVYPVVSSDDMTKVVLNCPQTFKVRDTAKPILSNVPANITVNCLSDILDAPAVTATDTACSDGTALTVTFKSEDSDHAPTCNKPFTRTRTWTANDGCGNTVTQKQVIKVKYTQPPTFTLTPQQTVGLQCASEIAPEVEALPLAAAVDQCKVAATITLNDITTEGSCANDLTVVRTWTATDITCGNTNTVSQTITVKDTDLPVIDEPTPIPGDPFQCKSELDDAIVPTVSYTDNCGGGGTAILKSEDINILCLNDRTRKYTWTAQDECGLEAVPKTISATVKDTALPVYVDGADAPEDPFQCKSLWNIFDIAPRTAHFKDNCDGIIDGTFVPATPVLTTKIDACKNKFTQDYTWTAKDQCGNPAAPHAFTATVDDDQPPTLTCDGAKDATEFDLCVGGSYPSGYPTITTLDNCDQPQDLTVVPDCCTDAAHALVTRTWTLQDSCGNVAAPCSQTITLTGNTCG